MTKDIKNILYANKAYLLCAIAKTKKYISKTCEIATSFEFVNILKYAKVIEQQTEKEIERII